MKKLNEVIKDSGVMQRKKQSQALPAELPARALAVKEHFKTIEEFAMALNPDVCSTRYFNLRTVNSALVSGTIKMNELMMAYDEESAYLYLSAWLLKLSSVMDFEVTPDQIDDTAKMLIQEISMFNLADITLLFNRIKKGHYGVFYGKFNPQLILVAAKEYRMEKITYLLLG